MTTTTKKKVTRKKVAKKRTTKKEPLYVNADAAPEMTTPKEKAKPRTTHVRLKTFEGGVILEADCNKEVWALLQIDNEGVIKRYGGIAADNEMGLQTDDRGRVKIK